MMNKSNIITLVVIIAICVVSMYLLATNKPYGSAIAKEPQKIEAQGPQLPESK